MGYVEWNGPKVGVFDNAEKRTRALAAAMNIDYVDINTELESCWGGEGGYSYKTWNPYA